MARTITKGMKSATIYVLNPAEPFETDEKGMPIANVVITTDGAPSMNRARIIAQKECGTKNVMVLSVDVDIAKVSISNADFIENSEPCEQGVTYGREFVTKLCKSTTVMGFAMVNELLIPFTLEYDGTTTDSKLHKFVCDRLGTLNATITSADVNEVRRYMSREMYLELANAPTDDSE